MTSGPSPDTAVTVVGGYLGSGKTTLLNRILQQADERVAVLVNDFGELDIDASLLDRGDGTTITLPNGCICCTIADGLAAALADVVALDPPPARLVIETSGVADPGGVAGYCHRRGLRLDLVLVVVDGADVVRQLADEYLADPVRAQLTAADVLVLNKLDLLDPPALTAARHAVAAAAPGVVTIETSQAIVDPRLVLDPEPAGPRDHPDHPPAAAARPAFASWAYTDSVPHDTTAFRAALSGLPAALVRVKGTTADPQGRRVVGHRVGARVSVTTDDGPAPDRTRLVAIGPPDALGPDGLVPRFPDSSGS